MSDQIEQTKENSMIYKTEAELHALLDGLAPGEHIKATWVYDHEHEHEHTMTLEGPVNIDGRILQCDRPIRWGDGMINPYLTSIEVYRVEQVTATRDDEKAMRDLLDSLEEGETITAEFGNGRGSTIMTGKVRTDGAFLEVYGYDTCALRRHTGSLQTYLHSVTVRRTVVKRWGREGNE